MEPPPRPPCPLDPSAEEIERWGGATLDFVSKYFSALRQQRLYPQTSSVEIRSELDRELPEQGSSFEELLEVFRKTIVPLSRQNAHPRMFGYVQAPGVPLAALADLLASTVNANLTAWRSAPAPVEIERLTIDWIKEILGLGRDAAGVFVSGGSMANLSALAVARQAKAPEVLGQGMPPRRLRLYASTETHHSIAKATALLGLGRENVRMIAVDERWKIRSDDLVAKITEDLSLGYHPFCVIGNAGTVNTGACDPLPAIKAIADDFGLWMHVDASYGGFATLAPTARPFLEGLAEADSIALDPHKWLYLPVDCGCVLYREGEKARETFRQDAEYTRVFGHDDEDEAFAFWDYGPELSRRFRAFKVWMVLKGVGCNTLSAAIENDLACARYLEKLVQASDDFEMLAPVELSIFCFRYLPPSWKQQLVDAGDGPAGSAINERIDRANEHLLVALQRDGSSYLSNTRIGGRFSLRGCVLNFRTTRHDMEILLEDLRRIAKSALLCKSLE